jgi:uncharacterized protein YkwD
MRARCSRAGAAVLLLAGAAAAGCNGGAAGGAGSGGGGAASGVCGGSAIACEVLSLVNAQRAAQSPPLAPLAYSVSLESSAAAHDDFMIAHGCFEHVCSGEADVATRIAATGYVAMGWGETIAAGYASPADVVNGWMQSPPHRAILLGDFAEVGIAYAECASGCTYGTYWTADFASPP